jgi:VanZ family protein
MPIERLAHLVCAVALLLTLLAGGGMAVPEAWDKAAHFTAFSLLTLFLWHATGMPLLAMGAALLFGGLDEWRQAFVPGRLSDAKDFLADACGVLATGALLFMQTKRTCAESSPR